MLIINMAANYRYNLNLQHTIHKCFKGPLINSNLRPANGKG